MTSLLLAEANKLKNIQCYLEKNENFMNNLSKYDWELFDYIVNSEKERTREIDDKIYCELKEVWKLLNCSRKFLQERNMNTLDLTSFKKGMVNLQDKIQALKSKFLFERELMKEQEKSLLEFNDLYNQKVTEWEKPTKLTITNCRKISNRPNNKYTKEVEVFMNFIFKSNGHENGWSSEDHQLFLKLRNKYKNLEDLAINLNKLLPDISIDDVKDHELWWRQYMHLKQKKKEAVENWQKTKNLLQKEGTDDTDKGNNSDEKSTSKIKITDENIREKIARWKAEKEAQKREEENMNQLKKEELKRIEEQKRSINTHMKEVVKRWRKEKIIKLEDEKIHKELVEYQEKRIRETEANKMIKHFQTRDDMFIARMRSKKRKEVNLTTKRSKSSYLAHRDPERIFKPTKQWTIKISKNDDIEENIKDYVPNIRAIPKLGVPQWRKVDVTSSENFF